MAAIPKHRKVLAEAIRRRRKEMGITQERLAELSALHHNYVGEVERGEKNISVDTLVRISRALDIPVAELLRGV